MNACNFMKMIILQYNLILNEYQMMLNRQIGTFTTAAPRTIGKFYQTQKIAGCFDGLTAENKQQVNPHPQGDSMKTRTKSVGHIYNTRRSISKEVPARAPEVRPPSVTKINYDRLINYNEMENKLSSYLQCTIKTNSRQKYNYLSTQYNQRYESLANANRIIEQKYGTDRPIMMRAVENCEGSKSIPLRQKKISLENQINLQNGVINLYNNGSKTLQNAQKNEKVSTAVKSDKKSLKNSRKSESKQILASHQASGSKNYKSSNKQNVFPIPTSAKKEINFGIVTLNHEEHKNQLENKLKKMINNYEVKNKQLQNQLKKIQAKTTQPQPQKKKQVAATIKAECEKQQPLIYKNEELKQILSNLIEFNLKGINLTKQCDQKLEEIWKSLHQQIIADEQLRMVKCFINQANINQIFSIINQNRIKKIDIHLLKTHPDEYDPFLIEKVNQFLKSNNPNLTHKQTCKWISEQFAKSFEASQKNWLKHLSQEKMECIIRTMVLEKEVTSLRKTDGSNKELLIRDFTRYLSTLFKANLRNRNIYQIHNKLKTMSYIGRFIELLEEKAGKGSDIRKVQPK